MSKQMLSKNCKGAPPLMGAAPKKFRAKICDLGREKKKVRINTLASQK